MAHSRRTRRMAAVAVLALVAAVALLPLGPAQADERQAHPGIWIEKNSQFNPANGVRGGSGTITDPYIISGWQVDVLYIKDTDAYVEIFNNTVTNVMVLDWIGDRVYVHGNDVDDLRVNQNVRRKGEATSGVISNNNFEVVGQLRHWDGIFEDNVVGIAPEAVDPQQPWDSLFDSLFDFRAVNFDGFNGAIFRDNTIYGYMDARLHGHHHSSGFGGNSHYHGAAEEGHSMMDMDHSKRFHEVWILNNKIVADSYYALAYLDTAHSANDRTAASERNEELNKPHVHTTRVHIIGNKLSGAGLAVEVFNAKDERHTDTNRGLVELKNNKIALVENEMYPWESLHGIYARSARDIDLEIVGNVITARDEEAAEVPFFGEYGAGIDLSEFDKGNVLIANTSVDNRYYGINAHHFSKTVFWMIKGFKTSNVQETVYWDESVKNPPEQNP